ncbi:hypothetical protein A2856_04365 [Candidatus Uhrbacteria bacterium RIFCSPHIGHO2_01_FULL_63_20]|uniref:Cohesin domain-containing protein n=1 Tax=Candidatus Uhrbacteria bacterium RIFCSPHIGHO2_01_FULL_63_20 TaxID=1802385 RepID=A0A1F7TP20_9BACT|nr:MAG: hypothetical protein A2856_04365 [Candidatus Uhrbacteria bacterium RIFCSPHIGHO2_01_FULL_63_20]
MTRLAAFAFGVIASMGCFFVASAAQAATMYLDPPSGSIEIDDPLTVEVVLSSPDEAVNAVRGRLRFPTELLEVSSVSVQGTAISLWLQQPTYSNDAGTIDFEGVVLNPGFQGNAARLFTVTLRGKGNGNADVTFTSGAILANDGKGTNVITGLSKATYTVNAPTVAPPVPEATTPVDTPGAPGAPQVSSPTHPSPVSWYKERVARFAWGVGAETTAVAYLLDRRPNSVPAAAAEGTPSSYTSEALTDGAWYFHVRTKNQYGWGGISHFRVQVDATAPSSFTATALPSVSANDPLARFRFSAYDGTSGIGHYEIYLGADLFDQWVDPGTHLYRSLPLPPGSHVLRIRAVDLAGNFLERTAEATVTALPAPSIHSYTSLIRSDEPLIVKGGTFPNARVNVWVQRGESGVMDTAQDQADIRGLFTIVYDRDLEKGDYRIWVTAVDDLGAQTLPSEEKPLSVVSASVEEIGNMAVRMLTTMVVLLSLLFTAGWLLAFIWRKLMWLSTLLVNSGRFSHAHVERTSEILRRDESLEQLKKDIKENEEELEMEVLRVERDKQRGEIRRPKVVRLAQDVMEKAKQRGRKKSSSEGTRKPPR